MNKRLLKSFMMKFGDSGESLSKYLGICQSTLSAKMNSYREYDFTQREIKMIKDRYKLKAKDVDEIFFAKEVS